MPGPLQRAKSLTEQAADDIRSRILRGDFELGTPLSENTLAAELGVSKTPIREALLQLKMDGLVSIQPQRGSFVFDMSADEIVQLGELREMMEVAALGLATARRLDGLVAALDDLVVRMRATLDAGDVPGYRILDAAFHQAFFDHSGNVYLAACYESFAFRVQALRARLSNDPDLNESSYREHVALVDLIRRRHLAEATARLTEHVRDTTDRYVAIRAERGDDPSGRRGRQSS